MNKVSEHEQLNVLCDSSQVIGDHVAVARSNNI